MRLQNFLSGAWHDGKGDGTALIDPVSGDEIARAGSDGLDLGAALGFSRRTGSAALRAMSYGERAAMIRAVADELGNHREAYYEIALKNSGNTKADAQMDIEGAIFTLKYYAAIGKGLGDSHFLIEPGAEPLARDGGFEGAHIWTAIHGAGIHINAFNFPAWGLWEKAAVSWLSGVAVFAKPATSTAWLSYQMVRDVIEAGLVPDGALSVVCGGARSLMDHVTAEDAIAFTGSAETAALLRANKNVLAANPRLGVEADSLNTCLIGPDAGPDSAEFALAVKEIRRELTVKAGQKCTAIRRILVPEAHKSALADALQAALSKVAIGDPRNEAVRMGPLVNKTQQDAAWEGIEQLKAESSILLGGSKDFEMIDADADKGCFVPVTLLASDDPDNAQAVHDVEVFGPLATLIPYKSADHATALAARGGGSLVASVFTGDDKFAAQTARALGPHHGRVLVVNEAVAETSTGHGNVMPQTVHGGPGRAGGGEELGGYRGLRHYHQRTAVQGAQALIAKLRGDGVEATL